MQGKPIVYFLILLCCCTFKVQGQTADTALINRLNGQSFKLLKKFPDSTVSLARQAIALSEKINYLVGLGDGYIRLGLVEKDKGNYEEAIVHYRKSLKYRMQIGNEDLISRVYNNMGMAFTWQAQYDSAFHYLLLAVRAAEKLQLKSAQATYLMNLGIAYENNRDYEKAFDCNRQAMKIYREEEDSTGIMKVLINQGTLYHSMKNYNEALQVSRKALGISLLLEDDRNRFLAIGNIAVAYQALLQYDSALFYMRPSLNYKTEVEDNRGAAIDMSNMGIIFNALGKNDSAVYYLEKSLAISEEIGEINLASKNAMELADVFSKKGDYKNAYTYHVKHSEYSDSVFNQDKAESIAGMQTKYETEKKEHEIKLLNKDKELNLAKIHRQEILRNTVITVAILIIVIGLLLFNHYRTSQKQKQQAERMRISSDLHDEVGSTLSSISMISSYAAGKISENSNGDAQKLVEEISSSALQMGDDMNDIIWAINPRNDSFESIVNRLKNYAARITESKNIVLHFSSNELLSKENLSMDLRKNIYLICKEAINNAVKYSDCKNLFVAFQKSKNNLHIAIQDDGKGFDVQNNFEGNGLKNMNARTLQSGGKIFLKSEVGKGTELNLEMKFS